MRAIALLLSLILVVPIYAGSSPVSIESPEAYVLNAFRDHDIVFLGENHYISEEPRFVQRLIPLLYERGIFILGMEFAPRESQDDIDKLLSSPEYNESLAINIMRRWLYDWAYQEYLDIFRAAWELNNELPNDKPAFRIVGLDEGHGYGGSFPPGGYTGLTRDRYMAETIKDEILSKGERALIYSHISHAYTKYYEWKGEEMNATLEELEMVAPGLVEKEGLFEKGCIVKRDGEWCQPAMGNWIYEEIGDRCETILFYGLRMIPLNEILPLEERGRIGGFDWENREYTDGYIMVAPLLQEHPVTIAERWFDEPDALEWVQNITHRNATADQFLELWEYDTKETVSEWQGDVLDSSPLLLARRMVKPGLFERLKLSAFLKRQLSPEDYIIDKFRNHDIIFLGESHGIDQNQELVQGLIPILYNSGIHVLGTEFAKRDSQQEIDMLLNGKEWNESLALKIFRDHYWPGPYQGYLDIFRAAWELNFQLPENAPKFRILGLDSVGKEVIAKEMSGTPEEQNDAFMKEFLRDKEMADTIKEEILSTNEKALVYCGAYHAFTKFHSVVFWDWLHSSYSEPEPEFYTNDHGNYWYSPRMGNYIYEEIGDRCMTILLHLPVSAFGTAASIAPFRGVLDQILESPVGFDLAGSPLTEYFDPEELYGVGYENYSFTRVADGYIMLDPIPELKSIFLPMEKWIDSPEALEWVRKCEGDGDLTLENAAEHYERTKFENWNRNKIEAFIMLETTDKQEENVLRRKIRVCMQSK